ncbi:MAG: hypothetical protein MJ073_01910 [Oscillibacter sp.]|nr:hypothetical protein [Oscillibacter sp.]
MLKKLLKHEFRATARTMLPMYLILLVASLGANLTTRGLLETEYPILDTIGVILVMLFVMAIIAVCVMTLVTMIERFCKNLLGDEGYLSMTLPVSVHQQVWTKLIVSVVWFAATAAAVVIAFCIMAFDLGVVKQALDVLVGLLRELWQNMSAYYALNGTAIVLELVVLVVVGLAANCLRFYAAMALGYSFANYKLPLAVVFFFVIGGVEKFLLSLAMNLLHIVNVADLFDQILIQHPMTMTHTVFVGCIVSQLILSGIFYFLTTYCLKNRLNLE